MTQITARSISCALFRATHSRRFQPYAEAAVLWQAGFADVQLGQHLDPVQDFARRSRAGEGRPRHQDAIQPQLDVEARA
uniref:Uncharacterized protein n=1 Tax=Ralstonia solanacearum TaxID=305 RepID=A0A0S4USS8_RALSL|nr:protein of unknown function [Ralstonia solanacearum]CUV59882.1 protein of unknown function [Ralstonia solanacearum]